MKTIMPLFYVLTFNTAIILYLFITTFICNQILSEAQSIMLWCSTPAAVWEQDIAVFSMYFREQHHDSLADYLHYKMVDEHQHNIHTQVKHNSIFHFDRILFMHLMVL